MLNNLFILYFQNTFFLNCYSGIGVNILVTQNSVTRKMSVCSNSLYSEDSACLWLVLYLGSRYQGVA
jgi:uncharacterized protein YmfQ (DUF2313 family)